jgi:hypothetical protein
MLEKYTALVNVFGGGGGVNNKMAFLRFLKAFYLMAITNVSPEPCI